MSATTPRAQSEVTLDPENWDELRSLGHRMLDDMFEQLEHLRGEPAWQPLPQPVRCEILDEALPERPTAAEQVYEDFLRLILPYTNGNRHPRAWGWVRGTGTPLASLAEMLAASMNAHLGGGQQAPTLIEEQCLRWLAQLMGMPPQTTGILTSGGTMANLLGLAVARNAKAGFDLRSQGLHGEHPRLLVYASTETHMWIRKSMELLGLGTDSLRSIRVDEQYRMDTAALAEQIRIDRSAGHRPIAVVATAGTVNTGAVDDLDAIAALCREQDLWFHVDGAFGALLRLAPGYRNMVRGLEKADSLAFDLHKWVYLPFEIGCVLVADPEAHTAAFASSASYLEPGDRGILAGGLPFSDRGIELTRGFKALKLWMSLRTHGVEAYRTLIQQNLEQAEHLEHLVNRHPELELVAPRATNIVCFRYRPLGVAGQEQLNEINREIMLRLQESGEFIVSGTTLYGNFALRMANTNHRSRMDDFDALAEAVVRLGRELC